MEYKRLKFLNLQIATILPVLICTALYNNEVIYLSLGVEGNPEMTFLT